MDDPFPQPSDIPPGLITPDKKRDYVEKMLMQILGIHNWEMKSWKTVLFRSYMLFLQPVGTHLAFTTLLGSVIGLSSMTCNSETPISLSLSLYGDRFPWLWPRYIIQIYTVLRGSG